MQVQAIDNVAAMAAEAPRAKPRGWQWPWAMAAVLGISVAAHAYLIAKAVGDPGLAVEKDYYRKAVAWDAEMDQQRANLALAWQLDARFENGGRAVAGTLADKDGRPVDGAQIQIAARNNANPGDAAKCQTEAKNGAFRCDLPVAGGSLYALQVRAERGSQTFTAELRRTAPR